MKKSVTISMQFRMPAVFCSTADLTDAIGQVGLLNAILRLKDLNREDNFRGW